MHKVIKQDITDTYATYNGDCIDIAKGIPTESVGFSIFSPPFLSLYVYSNSERDIGNNKTDDKFFDNFNFLIKELYRVMLPGRLIAIHCANVPAMIFKDGYIGLKDFRGDIIRSYQAENFIFHSEVCIWKDPLIEATRTKSKGLMYKQVVKDSSCIRQGNPDHLVVMRKPGENPIPIENQEGSIEEYGYIGSDPPGRNIKGVRYSHAVWRKYASPVWMDIRQTRTLNVRLAREKDDERHMCLASGSLVLTREGHKPIQDVNIGDLVLTHKGRWMPVIEKAKTGENEPVVSVNAQGVCGLRATPNHKLWAKSPENYARKKDAAKRAIPSWVESHDLKGMYVNLKLPPIQTPTNEDELTWWIVGRWLADGHIDMRNVAHISCGSHKISEFKTKVGKIAGNPRITTCHQFPLKDKNFSIRNILSECGKLAHGKHLPPEAFALPVNLAKAMLEGYLSGDGHYNISRKRWSATSVSYELLLGLKFIVQRVYGDVASLHKGRPPGTVVIEGREVNTRQEWILSWGGTSHSFSFIDDEGAWKRVRSVSDAGFSETWNLRVLEDESYTADGCVVKNCPLQLDTIERALFMWSTEGDTVFSPFMGIGSEGYCALQMGRKFIGIELKKSYYDVAVKNLLSVEAQNKNDNKIQSLF